MQKILIIGATGTIGRATTALLRQNPETKLVLFSRNATTQLKTDNKQVVMDGDALRIADLNQAMQGVDAVFLTTNGPVDKIAQQVVVSMQHNHVKRLVEINSVGIYNEVPPEIPTDNLRDSQILPPYRRAADIIENSDLDYLILRPGWFTEGPVNYETTEKGKSFGGMYVSIASIADAANRGLTEDFGHRASLGLNTPVQR